MRRLGVIVSVVIAGAAVLVLMHALKNIDYNEIFNAIRRTNAGLVALALLFVAISSACSMWPISAS